MGIKRVTIRTRPNIQTGIEFRKDLNRVINFLNEKSPQYFAYCFEQNDKESNNEPENEVHFHACFLSWNHNGCGEYERLIKEYLPWDKWLTMKLTDDRTGKNTGLFVNNMKRKNTEEEFVGYLFKDEEHHSIGWDTNHCLNAYKKGLEEAKVGWHTVWCFAKERKEYYYLEYQEELDNYETRKVYVETIYKGICKDIIDKYKDTISIGMVLNINKLLKESL